MTTKKIKPAVTRRILTGLMILFIFIQFFPAYRNNSHDDSKGIATIYPMPDTVKAILEVACNDCHSNYTVYPPYYKIQPIGWWMNSHIQDGKKHLNLSEFATYDTKKQLHKLDEIIESQEDKWMPLKSYTFMGMHPAAKLEDGQRKLIIDWAKAVQNSIENHPSQDSTNQVAS